jgi:outer membrane protein assembly factor BamB
MDGDRAILAPAGNDLVLAVDGATGNILWRTPNPRGWKMSHTSLVAAEIAGVKQYIYVAAGGVAGIRAADGALLWDTDQWQISIATVPSPVPVGHGKILLTGGYNAGALMLQVTRAGEHWTAQPIWRQPATGFGSDQQTPIFYDGHLYAVRPRGQLVCVTLDGNVRWDSGPHRFGLGPFVIADGKIFALSDTGRLRIVAATPTAFRLLGETQILHGHDAWGPLAIAGGRLLARDLTEMVCVDLAGRERP